MILKYLQGNAINAINTIGAIDATRTSYKIKWQLTLQCKQFILSWFDIMIVWEYFS